MSILRLNRPEARNALNPESMAQLGRALSDAEADDSVRAVVIASSEAKFGLPEVKRGLFAAGGGIVLGTRIPLAIALEMMLTGDYIDAERAYDLGLVNRVVAPDEVLDSAIELAETIARNGPLGLAATKELVRLAVADLDAAWKRQGELHPQVFGSEDAKEGATAFVEKREPVWKGR